MPPITITSSSRRAFRRCPQRYIWSYVDGLEPRQMDLKLWFGMGLHEAWARWYGLGLKRHRDWIGKFEEFCDSSDVSQAMRVGIADDKIWTDARELGIGMLREYRRHYGLDRGMDMIYTEEPFAIEIPHPTSPNKTVAVFNSTFDGVYRDKADGLVKLIEHKTAAQIRTNHLPMDDQAGAYWAVATQVLQDKGILGKRERIHGINYNIARKALPPTDRPRNDRGEYLNKDGSISKQQPPAFFHREFVERTRVERVTQIVRLGREALAIKAFASGRLEPFKNTTMDCFWDCQFHTMCQLHDQGAEWREFRDAMFVKVDPYSRYRTAKAA